MIKVGVIGLGEVAQQMHLPILSDLEDRFELVAVGDVSPSLVDFISKKYHVKGYLSAQELINDPNVEAVLVLSPDQHHGEYAKAAMRAGKSVFIEKPVTICTQELDELIEVEKETNALAMVGYMRRYAAPFLKAKEIIASQPLPIRHVRCRDVILEAPFYLGQTHKPFYPSDVPADLIASSSERRKEQLSSAIGADATAGQRQTYQMLTGLGCHTLSAVRELIGMPQKILSVSTEAQGQHVVIVMQYEGFLCVYELVNDQAIVEFDAAIEVYQQTRKVRVKYETPYLRYQPASLEVIESTDDDTKTTVYGPYYTDAFKTELIEFYECIKNGRKPKSNLTDSRNDLVFFQQIMDCLKKNEG